MNRESIFFKLNIIFGIALVAIILAGASITTFIQKKDKAELLYKSRLIIKEQRIAKLTPKNLYKEFRFKEIKGDNKQEIVNRCNSMRHQMGNRLSPKRSRVIKYKDKTYIYIKTPRFDTLLYYQEDTMSTLWLPILITIIAIILLISMYIMLRKALIPLKHLERDVILYGDGVIPTHPISTAKDEISMLSNAFYHSIEKVKRLTDSRDLFIRNIFHELNTPVTKGKLLAEISNEPQTKQMLTFIFDRLSSLLKSLAHMEQITSHSYTFEPSKVAISSLISKAQKLLYISDDIKTNITNETIKADEQSMSIVFKNIIDNAIKHGEELHIEYSETKIDFISRGEKLDGDFQEYLKPFSSKNQSQSRGFGLGLYICHEILSRHGMRLEYRYVDGCNHFEIRV